MKLLKELVMLPINFLSLIAEPFGQFLQMLMVSEEDYEKLNELKFQQEVNELIATSTLSVDEIEEELEGVSEETN